MGFLADLYNKGTLLISYISDNLKALLVRVLFGVHGIIVVWRVTDVYHDPLYYLLAIPVVLLLVEMLVTAKFTENGEWKWFCPSVFLYLMCVIPGLWLLQLDLYEGRIAYRDAHDLDECGDDVTNATGLRDIQGVAIPLALNADDWALALEQILFFLLIMGRWLLPKGQLTRDQLSQLLLVYIGIAADSLEFSLETLKIQQVRCDIVMISLIIAIWSWSLLQFTLVLTSVSAPRPRMAAVEKSRSFFGGCCENEIWALIITMCLQDAPYLAMRLYLMIDLRVINQMMIFFTVKNGILVILQVYRMGVLCCVPKPEQVEPMDTNSMQSRDTEFNSPIPERKMNTFAMDAVTILADEFKTIDYDQDRDQDRHGVPETDRMNHHNHDGNPDTDMIMDAN